MSRTSTATGLTLIAAATLLAMGALATSFADEVVEFVPGLLPDSDASEALGAPEGDGPYSSSTDVATLGAGGSVTLRLQAAAHDGAGTDLIVSENPFFLLGDPRYAFSEVMTVEVSTDGDTWAAFPTEYLGPAVQPGPFAGVRPEWYRGFAGALPVYSHPSLPFSPLDPVEAGGDAFDLDDLNDDPAVLAGDVDLTFIRYVRLTDVESGIFVDDFGHTVYDAGLDSFASTDVDAVTAVNSSLNALAIRPQVELSLDSGGFLTISLFDPVHIDRIVPGLQASVNGKEVDFFTQIMPLFLLIQLTDKQATFITGPIPPGMFNAILKVSGETSSGLVSGDAIHVN